MYKSIAVWPKGTYENEYGEPISSDIHDSESAAKGVCDLLKRKGFACLGKIFPLETKVVKLNNNQQQK